VIKILCREVMQIEPYLRFECFILYSYYLACDSARQNVVLKPEMSNLWFLQPFLWGKLMGKEWEYGINAKNMV
jgi:hypothetical protein